MPSAINTLQASGQIRLLLDNTTANAFAITAGRTATALEPSETNGVFSLGPLTGSRFRGVALTFFGAGTAGQTIQYRIYRIGSAINTLESSAAIDYERILWCSGTVTLGTSAGVGNSTARTARTTDLIGDAIANTNSAYCVAAVTAKKGIEPTVATNGANTIARLYIPEFDNARALQAELIVGTATSANCLVEREI